MPVDEDRIAAAARLIAGRPARERLLRQIMGDACILLRRFEAAVPHFLAAGDPAEIVRLRDLGVAFGRYRLVRSLEGRVPPERRLSPEAWRRFLRERALPQVPIGGDARAGFAVDEAVVHEIAADLGEPAAALLAATARLMLARGSRHAAKLYVFARLSGDPALVAAVAGEFHARAADPRANLPETVRAALERRGGRLLETLQAGDADDYNPKSANLFRAALDGRPVVLKENLRLPTNFSRIDGESEEREVLEAAAGGPGIVPLLGALEVGRHELLILALAPGERLEARAAPEALLPRGEAIRATAALARALAHLHERRIVHLDVKARNVLRDGPRVTLLDFGMARRLAPGDDDATSLLSTPESVPPEMARTFRGSGRSDVFQLGILLYRLVVGRHPFVGAGVAHENENEHEDDDDNEMQMVKYALANLHGEPAFEAIGDSALAALLGRMLERRPEARPDASEAADALGRLA